MQKVTTGKNVSAAVPKKKVESSEGSSESESSDDEVICGFHSYVTLVLLLVAFGYEFLRVVSGYHKRWCTGCLKSATIEEER